MSNTPILLGSKEVCARLDINRSTLTRWVDSGRIKAAQKLPAKNGAYLFAEDEVARIEGERLAGAA